MTPGNALQRLLESDYTINDPGASGTIVLDRNFGVLRLISATAESRTLPVPTKSGLQLLIDFVTDGGDVTLTVTSGYDEAGSTTMTFNDTGDYAQFISVEEGSGTYRWRLTAFDGVTGPSSTAGSLTLAGSLSVGTTALVTGVATLTGGVANGIPRNIGTWNNNTATSGTDTACSNGTAYCGSIFVPANCTVTGIQYLVGSVGGTDSVVASLHNSSGTLLANSALAGATVGTAAQVQQVALTSTYAAVGPAYYFLAVTFNGTTAKFRTIPAHCQAGSGVIGNGVTQTFGTAATFTAPTTFTADKVPVASLY